MIHFFLKFFFKYGKIIHIVHFFSDKNVTFCLANEIDIATSKIPTMFLTFEPFQA